MSTWLTLCTDRKHMQEGKLMQRRSFAFGFRCSYDAKASAIINVIEQKKEGKFLHKFLLHFLTFLFFVFVFFVFWIILPLRGSNRCLEEKSIFCEILSTQRHLKHDKEPQLDTVFLRGHRPKRFGREPLVESSTMRLSLAGYIKVKQSC